MWKILSTISAANMRPMLMINSSLTNAKALSTIGFRKLQINNQIRFQSESSLPNMKTSLNEAKEAEQAKSQQSKNKQSNPNSYILRLLGFFASGAVAYFAISFYLDHRSVNKTSGAINYSSPNIPGRIKPSKSVRGIFFLRLRFHWV
jgi:hypothetical protein